jgi:phospholipid-binding lipoprotein MlaA|tara:strand:- start:297 stop:1025 length:729 start_codon:yes stop_codon:yes gene_type:complete
MKKIFILLIFAFSFHSEEAISQYEEDPFEDFNRIVFNVADRFDSAVLRPTAEVYSEYTPTIVKNSVSNFFNNLSEVDTIANQLLQGKFKLAIDDTFRFFINSTFGIAGIFDVATGVGLERHNEDFGQTLGYWGFSTGAYIFTPIVGPTTVRDFFAYPTGWLFSVNFIFDDNNQKAIITMLDVIETRERLLVAENLIVGDKYSFVKDVYFQSRESQVNDGNVEDEFLMDFDFDSLEEDLPENQ